MAGINIFLPFSFFLVKIWIIQKNFLYLKSRDYEETTTYYRNGNYTDAG